jgi:hypothetical protein
MGRIKYLTSKRFDEIREIINNTTYVEGPMKNGNPTRVEKLRKLGYEVRKVNLGQGRAPVGLIHHLKKEIRFQIGSRQGWYAWCVILNPLPYDTVRDYNIKTFGGLL